MSVKGMNEPTSLTKESMDAVLGRFGLTVSHSMADQINTYLDLLIRWNRKISLTSVRDPLLLLERHFGESLFGAVAIGIESGTLLDVGSGAGFPGLAIAVLRPKLRATLLEPSGKKAAFLGEVSRQLGISARVRLSRSRLEEFSAETGFDFITSRAVRVTASFLQQCSRLLRPGGALVLWIGYKDAEAVAENRDWTWNRPVRVPGSEQRCVISATPRAK